MTAKQSRSILFVKNTLAVFTTKIILVIIKLTIGILTARVLGPEGKGIFVLALQLPGLLATFTNLSLGEALIYNIGKGKIQKNKILGNILFFTITVGAIIFVSYYYLLPYLSITLLKNIDLNILKISFLLTPLIILDYLSLSTFKGFKKFALYNRLSIFSRSLSLCAIFTALIILGTGVKGTVSTYIIFFFVSIIVFIGILFFLSEKKISFSWKELKSLVTYGFAVHIAVVLSELEYRFDVFILNYFLTPAHVGIYSVGVTIAHLLWYISNSVNTVLFPEIAGYSQSEAAKFLPSVCRNVFFICGLAGLFITVTGYYLIELLYGKKFVLAYSVYLILLPGLLLDTIFRILSSYFKGIGRPILVTKVIAVTLCLNLLLNFIIIPIWGVHAAAISASICYFLNAGLLLIQFRRDNQVKLSDFFIIRKIDLVYYTELFNRLRGKIRTHIEHSDIRI